MTQTILPPVKAANPSKEVQLAELVARYSGSQGVMMRGVGILGTQTESVIDMMPEGTRAIIEKATYHALESSFSAAAASRGTLPDTASWTTSLMAATTGAVGGFGGLATALAELPVTTTLILRAIQGIAAEHGFDPDDPDTRADCLRVFSAAGPMSEDDGTDLSFLTLRASVSGAAMRSTTPSPATTKTSRMCSSGCANWPKTPAMTGQPWRKNSRHWCAALSGLAAVSSTLGPQVAPTARHSHAPRQSRHAVPQYPCVGSRFSPAQWTQAASTARRCPWLQNTAPQ